jgi:CO dehydrogenase maturation factor
MIHLLGRRSARARRFAEQYARYIYRTRTSNQDLLATTVLGAVRDGQESLARWPHGAALLVPTAGDPLGEILCDGLAELSPGGVGAQILRGQLGLAPVAGAAADDVQRPRNACVAKPEVDDVRGNPLANKGCPQHCLAGWEARAEAVGAHSERDHILCVTGASTLPLVKIAIAGKGGTGKTTIAGTMVREFAAWGRRVTAIDADPNPTLAMTVGIDDAVAEEATALPAGLLEQVTLPDGSTGFQLRLGVDEILASVALDGPDGIRLVIAGRVEHAARGCMCGTHAAVRAILGAIAEAPADVVLVDMEAGIEHFSRAAGTLRYVDGLIILVEPFYKSLVTAKSVVSLSAELGIPRRYVVANKVRNPGDLAAIDDFCAGAGLELIGTVPWDPTFQDAESRRAAPFDFAPTSAGVTAARALPSAVFERLAVPAVG